MVGSFTARQDYFRRFIRKGTLKLSGFRYFKRACTATQKSQRCGSLADASSCSLYRERTVKALARLRRWEGLPEPSLAAFVIANIFS